MLEENNTQTEEQSAVQQTSIPAPVPIQEPGTPPAAQTTPTTPPTVTSSAPKEDWFLTRVKDPYLSTKDLFDVYGVDGFNTFKSKEEYWKNKTVQKIFTDNHGSEARLMFDEAYDNAKKEFSKFQLGQYQRAQTGYELLRDDISSSRAEVTLRFTNMAGTIMQGEDWSAPTKDYRENFNFIKTRQVDDNGVASYVTKAYSPELLKELEQDPTFGGLAYSDAFYGIDPNEGVNGLYFNVIHDGQIFDENSGKLKDVRNDQVVSRWDIDTGDTTILGAFNVNLNNILKNNKLEADGVLDYAKILVKTPINMAVNVLDTAVQLTRATVAGTYGLADMLSSEDLDVRESETYKWLTNKGIGLKSNLTSQSRESLQDGFFGSLEAALTTTADIALQVALAGGLGRAASGAVDIIGAGLTEVELMKAKNRAAEVFVRGTLTALSVKDSYNEAIENGFSTKEASVIAGAMSVAMWHATSYASYIFGDYEVKVLRQNIKTAMQEEQKGMLKTLFASVTESTQAAAEAKAKYSLKSMQEAVSKVFGTIVKKLPPGEMLYAARQEGLEEMTEELFQDGVKHAASAYGYLINNAHVVGQGRYLSIFDPGYFKDAVQRYASSGIAGGLGGPIGMIGRHTNLSPITSASSVTDILLSGKKQELISVLEEMKNEGALGPKNLSVEYNDALEAFEPLVQGSGEDSLADMVFNTYLHDINVIDTFINKGMFGKARQRIEESEQLKSFVDNNSMRKDYVKLMGSLLEFHTNAPSISMAVYDDIDAMTEGELATRMPPAVLQGHKVAIAEKRKEIDDLKELLKTMSPGDEPSSAAASKPKTEDKKEKDSAVIGESPESKLTRLEKEIKLSAEVSEKDIIKMLGIYRKIRAISTGTAAEYYLLQNDLADNKVIGAKYNRDKKHESLGEEPFKDMLMSMRFRYLDDEKIHAQTEIKAAEVEGKILAIKSSDNDSIDELSEILKKTNISLLSEKALKAISKLYSKADFSETGTAFNPDDEESIFDRDADGKVTDASLLEVYKNIMALSEENYSALEDQDNLDLSIDASMARKYFKKLSKDPKKAFIPIWESNEEGELELMDGPDLIGAIMSSTDSRLRKALKVSGDSVVDLRKMADIAENGLSIGNFYKSEPFKKQGINALFKRSKGEYLTRQTLVDEGLSVVRAMIDSSHEGIYTYTDHSEIDDVLNQIDVRLEMAKVFSSFTRSSMDENGVAGKASHYLKMLATFRKNVLGIIDFKYKYNSPEDTEIEEHSYKDYTTTSDFFVDFLYDPVKYVDLLGKDVDLHTEEDAELTNSMKRAQALAGVAIIKDSEDINLSDPTVNDILTIEHAIEKEPFFAFLENRFGKDIKQAARFFESSKVIAVPHNVFGLSNQAEEIVYFDGAVKLLASKWLFEKARGIIMEVSNKATILPYIQAKNNDIAFTSSVLNSLIEAPSLPELTSLINEEVPEYALAVRKGIKDLSPNEVGALNIKIEAALYNIYNNTISSPLLKDEHDKIKEKLEDYVFSISTIVRNNMYNSRTYIPQSDNLKKLSILVGAFTTDFLPFYSKFKRDIIAMTPDDRIVAAAQEHAAKYSGAYIYSPGFKKLADALSNHRVMLNPHDNISAVYVMGKAGSGKSSATVQMGLKIAMEILEDSGAVNTAVLPVSTFKSQVDIISKGVGDLSKGLEGVSVSILIQELESAVIEKNDSSIKKLLEVGVIAIDEATYVEAVSLDKDSYIADLDKINSLIKAFNAAHNTVGHEIGLLLLGDPKQSGATKPDGDVLYDVSLDIRRVHPIAYMDFSFRSRNNFLVDSLSAITKSIDNNSAVGFTVPSNIILEEGVRYGITANRYYGINITDSTNKSSSEELYKTLNDVDFVANIEANILKTIQKNAAGDGSNEEVFKVLIVPADIASYNSTPSALKTLSEREGYEKYFSVVSSFEVGGSEANYVIGELMDPDKDFNGESSYIKTVEKSLNTLATRAFDYVHIINRSNVFVVPASNRPEKMPEDTVSIPDSTLDNAAKEGLKKNYLEIFKDITPGEAIIKKVAVVVPNVTPFAIKKEPVSDAFAGVASFISGENAMLTSVGSKNMLGGLSEEDHVAVTAYLTSISSMLFDKESIDSEEFTERIVTLDNIIRDIKDSISPEAFEQLVNLQVLATTILEDIELSNILKTYVDSALLYLSVEESVLKAEIDPAKPGVTTEDFIALFEGSLNDTTTQDTNNNLFLAALEVAKYADDISGQHTDDEIAALSNYNALLSLFFTDNFGDSTKSLLDALTTSDNLRVYLDSIILAKATFLLSNVDPVTPDVTPSDILSQASDFEEWLYTLGDMEVTKLVISQLHEDSASEELAIPERFSELFDLGFTAESIKKVLYDSAILVKAKLEADLVESDSYKKASSEMDALKEKLGLSGVVNAMELYRKISAIEKKLRKDMLGKAPSNDFDERINDILEISDAWNRLYKGRTSLFGADEYGTGFVQRDLSRNRKETLEDYIKEANLGGGIYTVGVTKGFNALPAAALNPRTGIKNVVLTPKQALGLFNYNNTMKGEIPTKAKLRVIKRMIYGKPVIDVLLMASTDTVNYVISQINTEDNSNVTYSILEELNSVISDAGPDSKFPFSYTATNKKGVTGTYNCEILDLDIETGSIKDFMYTRPGGIVTLDTLKKDKNHNDPDNYIIPPIKNEITGEYNMLTVADLLGDATSGKNRVNVSSTVYVDTHKETGGKSSAGNLLGEGFTLYSTNMSTNLDSATIVDNMETGQGMSTTERIKDSAGNISTQLGIMKVTLKPPLDKLGEIMVANPHIEIGRFVSNFSLALQEYFIDSVKDYKVGETELKVYVKKGFEYTEAFKKKIDEATVGSTVEANIDGINRSFTLTPEVVEYANSIVPGNLFNYDLEGPSFSYIYSKEVAAFMSDMSTDLERYYKEKNDDGSHRKEVQDIISKMKKEAPDELLELANAFTLNKLRVEGKATNRKYDIIYRDNSGGYIFNVNEYLRNHPTSILKKIDKLSSFANYSFKPSVSSGNTTYVGKLDPIFMKLMPEAFQVSTLGIKTPSFIISEKGTAIIRTAIMAIEDAKIDTNVALTSDQSSANELINNLVNLSADKIANNLVSLGKSISFYEDLLTNVKALEVIFKNNSNASEEYKNTLLVKPEIEAVIDTLKGALFTEISINDFLPDHAMGENNVYRDIAAALVLGYNVEKDADRAEILLSTLDNMLEIGPDVADSDVAKAISERVDDPEILAILESCKLN